MKRGGLAAAVMLAAAVSGQPFAGRHREARVQRFSAKNNRSPAKRKKRRKRKIAAASKRRNR